MLLINAKVLDLANGESTPRDELRAVAVKGGIIAAVGEPAEASAAAGPGAEVIDCQGRSLIPGLVDAHCHLLALASSLRGLDCRPARVSTIAELQRALILWAAATPPYQWVRGFGYDDRALAERRHPNRYDLDPFSVGRPVRIDHRSGHASVLNSRALELLGIDRHTPDPVDGVIERDPTDGEPTGLLFEMGGFLRRKIGDSQDPDGFRKGVQLLEQRLLKYGLTAAHDAGPENNLARWNTFRELRSSGQLSIRITMMAGFEHLQEFIGAGLKYGDGEPGLSLGHAKIMTVMTTGTLQPGAAELEEMVRQAHAAGFPVAIHAVEQEAVAAAAGALVKARGSRGRLPANDRIEHCSECPAPLVRLVAQSGADVVTQPGLVYWQGDGYLADVEPGLLPHLYPAGALLRAGVNVAFSSDAPVTDPKPWPAIYGAVTRKTLSGALLAAQDGCAGEVQRVSVMDALRMYTGGHPARVVSGSAIRRGGPADLVLLDRDPAHVDAEELTGIRAVMTIIGGIVAWKSS